MLGSGDNIAQFDKTFGKMMIGKTCTCGIVGQNNQWVEAGNGARVACGVKLLPAGADFSGFGTSRVPDRHVQADLLCRNPVHQ